MGFRELEYLQTLAQYQNITRAAEALHITQPTLSKFLINFEEKLGQKLFRRVGNRYFLTMAGQIYIIRAAEILKLKEDLDREMEVISQEGRGILNVGFPPGRLLMVAPTTLPEFEKIYPNVQVNLKEGSSDTLERMVIEGTLDLAFYNMPVFPDSMVDYRVLLEEELLLCMAADSPLLQKAVYTPGEEYPEIALSDVCDQRFLRMRPDQRIRQRTDQVLKEKDITFAKTADVENVQSMLRLAGVGYGVCFAYSSHVKLYQAFSPIGCCRIKGERIHGNFVCATRKNGYMPPYGEEYIKLVKELVQK